MLNRHGSRFKKPLVLAALGPALAFAVLVSESSGVWAAVTISAPKFKSAGEGGTVTLQGDGDFAAVKDEQAKDNQVIFEISGAKLESGADREVPTSSFAGSKLKLLKAYAVPDKPETVRLVLQLADTVPVEMKQEGKVLTLQVGSASSASAAPPSGPPVAASPPAVADSVASSSSQAQKATEPAADSSPASGAGEKQASVMPAQDANTPPADVPTSEEGKQIQALVDARAVAKFTGKPISIQVRDAELSDVLNLIAEASGFNIILSDGVKGKVNLSLVDVPWDQALDVVLRTKKLTAERSHNVLRVLTFDELTAEKQAELVVTRVTRAAAQKSYRIFRPAYVTDLEGLKSRMLSIVNASTTTAGIEGVSAGANSGTSTGGTITVDTRTNSLIVYDAPETLEMMARILKYLDRPIAQVLIESRIVEASENFAKGLSGSLGAIGAQGGVAFNGDPAVSGFLGSTGVGLGLGDPSAALSIAAQPSISFIPGFNRLSAILQLSETERQIKTVSNPRTVTLEDNTPNVQFTQPMVIQGGLPAAGPGGAAGNLPQSAVLGLSMRPKVLADGSVKLESLRITADDPVGTTGISSRSVSTAVVVENGSTLMVGGIYKNNETIEAFGIPLLRSIPVLGWLFGSERKSTARSELLFFVTPRVLNEKDLGLGKTTVNL